ncbi:molybdenum cofactor biosynthesis protein moaB [Thermoplasma volcanium GSS1]|uniref:Molybdenum cofactor biosynthesis protein moaB n=1 Tax=Thermoplasma volcanium (strain ATCC 51530 / DSM 4299 / JCM 9571 / NBRC 15438 / GSS1) TaxID=273116 RepID=Q97AP9_THEVO|nr:molybdenum cofactor biosynthesis protein B [Thermoplasma volcanium]BAB59903.1 molybdenum cofactor biosynthesis protein moaB [Thermoplasma volcanium GSS1]
MTQDTHHSDVHRKLRIKVVTVSSTRNINNDESGKILEEKLGFHNISREVVRDDPVRILSAIFSKWDDFDAFVLNGGTGISKYDVTTNTLRRIADKEIPGFGELFRRMGESDAGVFSYLSGAGMFIVYGKPIFSLPGAPSAQPIGASLILDILDHVFHEITKE